MIVTTAEWESYQGVVGDTLASTYLSAAQQIVEDYLHYRLEEKSYVSAVPGTDTNKVRLMVRPVTEVTEVKIDDVVQTLSEFVYDEKGYLTWKKGVFSSQSYIEVSYKGGWEVVDDVSTCPSMIKMCVMQIAGLMQTESGDNIGISSKSFGESGSRVFLNTKHYAPYLQHISSYRFL